MFLLATDVFQTICKILAGQWKNLIKILSRSQNLFLVAVAATALFILFRNCLSFSVRASMTSGSFSKIIQGQNSREKYQSGSWIIKAYLDQKQDCDHVYQRVIVCIRLVAQLNY